MIFLILGLYFLYSCDALIIRNNVFHDSVLRLCAIRENIGLSKDPFRYSGSQRPADVGPSRFVPEDIVKPDYSSLDVMDKRNSRRFRDLSKEIRVAGRIARLVLDAGIAMVQPGVSTDEIDQAVHAACLYYNVYPSPLHYRGFPKSCCTSVNEVMCHGIPCSSRLRRGDIINVDVTVFCDGVHADCSETVFVGNEASDDARDLVVTAYNAWRAAIEHCYPGMPYSSIGGIVEDNLRSPVTGKLYSCPAEYCGHG
jgi:methionyl aminopeptidase